MNYERFAIIHCCYIIIIIKFVNKGCILVTDFLEHKIEACVYMNMIIA